MLVAEATAIPTIHFHEGPRVEYPQEGIYYDVPGHGFMLCFDSTPTGAWFQGALGSQPVFIKRETLVREQIVMQGKE
jgi:hypothetical protein